VYHEKERKESCLKAAQEFMNTHLEQFRAEVIEKVFDSLDELEIVDIVMAYLSKVGDSSSLVKDAVKHARSLRDEYKGGNKEEYHKLDRKYSYLLYSLGRVYIAKDRYKDALEIFYPFKSRFEKAETWEKLGDIDLEHFKAKVLLQQGIAQLGLADENKILDSNEASAIKKR
jgi:hypothetical protein